VTITKDRSIPPEEVELIPAARDQEPVLANLLELYAHDFSEFQPLELRSNGRFEYKDLSRYWRDPNRHPFLVKVEGKLAGLILIRKDDSVARAEVLWDLAEFFVVRRYRRQGVGTSIAHAVWRKFPGRWQVRVMEANLPAHHFWQHAITKFTGAAVESARIERAGEHWRLFTFESKEPKPDKPARGRRSS
jgi:predicted acetyltransferase